MDIQARVWQDPDTGVIRIISSDSKLTKAINVAVPVKGSAAETIRKSLATMPSTPPRKPEKPPVSNLPIKNLLEAPIGWAPRCPGSSGCTPPSDATIPKSRD